MRYRQIVFDVDGTLVDTEQAVLCSLQDTLAQMTGQRAEREELTFALGIPGEDALRRLQVGDIPAALALWDRRMGAYRDTIRVFAGMEELLRDLRAAGYGLGVVTSKTREELAHDLAGFEIVQYFDCVVCADDTARHKPDPEPLLYYLEQTGCRGVSTWEREAATPGKNCAFLWRSWGGCLTWSGSWIRHRRNRVRFRSIPNRQGCITPPS